MSASGRCVAEHPDKPFIRYGKETLSYERTQLQARALAAALHNLGIGAGDRVGIDLPNGPEFVVSALAAANLGAAIVPLNPAYSPHELQFTWPGRRIGLPALVMLPRR